MRGIPVVLVRCKSNMAAAGRRFLRFLLKNYLPGGSTNKVSVPKGVVLMRQPATASNVPSLSPMALKLETYLRLAQIPHDSSFGPKPKVSSKGKIPWIEYNGKRIADSNFCIKFLNEEFNVDLDAELSASERGISNAVITMLEENTYWTMVYFRWIQPENAPRTVKVLFPNLPDWARTLFLSVAQKIVKQYLNGHGIGRHTSDEIYYIASRDLKAVSAILGDKPFIMGPEPTLVDTAAFGLLGNLLWHDVDSPQNVLITGELKNIQDYCERMKSHVWPDWDEVIAKRKEIMKPAKSVEK